MLPNQSNFPDLLPRSLSSTVDEQGRRLLGLAARDRIWVQAWTADGAPEHVRHDLFDMDPAPSLADSIGFAQQVSFGIAGRPWSRVLVDRVEFLAGGQSLHSESFGVSPTDWELIDTGTAFPTQPQFLGGWLEAGKFASCDCPMEIFARHALVFEGDLRVEAEVWLGQGIIIGVQIGEGVVFRLDDFDDQMTLQDLWKGTSDSLPFDVLSLTSYVLVLEVAGERLTASVETPYLWGTSV